MLRVSERMAQADGGGGCIYTGRLVTPLRVLVSDWLTAVAGCAGLLSKLGLRALGNACRSSDCWFNVGFVSFIYSASKMGRRLVSGHVVRISVLSTSIPLVMFMLCFSFRCFLGAPVARWKVSRWESLVVVMPT